MSGAPRAFDQMIDSMIMGGKLAMLGIPSEKTPVDWARVIFKALTIKGIYGREMFETWYKMIAMLQSGLNVRKVITHRLKARDYARAFELMKQGSAGKIVLDWTD
jgi:threonine 3-dehydrogenase